MLVQPTHDLDAWITDRLGDASVPVDVKSYVQSVLVKHSFSGIENSSIVLACSTARTFVEFQAIGDFGFWRSAIGGNLEHQRIIDDWARWAYHRCYVSSLGRIHVYERMADEFASISSEVHRCLFQAYLPFGSNSSQ